mmetsp:Transcript_79390/g.209018  ORF Transcript_79390/g.209018 Transcript_79390/m.209018 type:complete len:142 (+) Transcript_79390:23-448(+)
MAKRGGLCHGKTVAPTRDANNYAQPCREHGLPPLLQPLIRTATRMSRANAPAPTVQHTGGQPTRVLQVGHWPLQASHWSTQLLWKQCVHPRERRVSPSEKSSKQTAQLPGESPDTFAEKMDVEESLSSRASSAGGAEKPPE